MTPGKLATELFDEISKIPGINSHSHLVPNNHTAIQPHGPIYLYAYSRLTLQDVLPMPSIRSSFTNRTSIS